MATETVKIKFETTGLKETLSQVKALVKFTNQAVKLADKLAKRQAKIKAKTK